MKVRILRKGHIKKSLASLFFLFGVERDQNKNIYRWTIPQHSLITERIIEFKLTSADLHCTYFGCWESHKRNIKLYTFFLIGFMYLFIYFYKGGC